MAYKKETIINLVNKANAIAAEIIGNTDSYHVCISKGNRKIGLVMNVSLAPVLSCGNCGHCCKYCYDIKACLRFVKNVLFNRVKNLVIAREDRERFFREIREAIRRRKKNFFFRWHVAGDILNSEYFAEMVAIAKEFDYFTFWTYTKMYDIVNNYVANNGGSRAAAIPENLKIMFSEWDGMPMNNPYHFPVFAVKLIAGNKDRRPEEFDMMYKCPGNCDICKKICRGCIAGEDTYNDEH